MGTAGAVRKEKDNPSGFYCLFFVKKKPIDRLPLKSHRQYANGIASFEQGGALEPQLLCISMCRIFPANSLESLLRSTQTWAFAT